MARRDGSPLRRGRRAAEGVIILPEKAPKRKLLSPKEKALFLCALVVPLTFFSIGGFNAFQNFQNQRALHEIALAQQKAYESPQEILQRISSDPIEVVYTDSKELNCSGAHGGCFRSATPQSIYISSTIAKGKHPGVIEYLTLHEYAHYMQHRDGKILDECEADEIAEALGADLSFSSYEEKCKGVTNE